MSTTPNPFEIIKQKMDEYRANLRERAERSKAEKEKAEKFDLRILELKDEANEYRAMMQDNRYPRATAFLEGMRKELSGALERIAASGTNRDELALQAKGIASEIRIIDKLLSRPEAIIADWVKLEKDLKEKGLI